MTEYVVSSAVLSYDPIDTIERLTKQVEEAKTAYEFNNRWFDEWNKAVEDFISYDPDRNVINDRKPLTALAKRERRNKVKAARKAAQRNKGR